MLNRKMLNQYLEEYHVKVGPLRKYKPLSWVTYLCDFASTLQDDSPLDAMQEAKLKEIMYLRPSNQPLCDLAKKHKHIHIAKRLSYVKLKQTIDTIAHAPVSRNAVTLFGKTIKYAYSNEETLAAAIALKMAVKSGDQTLLDEHRHVLEKAKELAPLYRHLI